MKTYITSFFREDIEYTGTRISAYSWLEAEGIVGRLDGVILLGVLRG